VAARGRAFALAAPGDSTAFDRLERLLASAARRRGAKRVRTAAEPAPETEDPRFPITQLAADKLRRAKSPPLTAPIDLPQARTVLTAAEKAIRKSDKSLRGVAAAIRLEIAIAEAEEASSEHPGEANNPVFRLRAKRWGMMEGDLGAMVPTRDPRLHVLTFDAAELSEDQTAVRAPRSSHVLAFAAINGERREPLFVCDNTVRILELSDGTRNAEKIAAEIEREQAGTSAQTLRAIEELFVAGLLWLREGSIDQVKTNRARLLKLASV
jgi:hypothetical protein